MALNDWAEFRHIRYLLAIVENESLRAAADQLHTSEPNLSVQARQFQETFALQLYVKGKDRRIELTETGIAFRSIARGLLNARDEAIAALIAIERGQVRSLSLGCTPCVDSSHLHLACELHREILPDCAIRRTHVDVSQLSEEISAGELDAALVTFPIAGKELDHLALCRDRLVACLRADHPLARKSLLHPRDLSGSRMVFYDPKRHPEGHGRLLKLLAGSGIQAGEHSRATHPYEIQSLVKAGDEVALVREGSVHDPDLTTRPVSGEDWFVETALVYHREIHPKTIPVLASQIRYRLLSRRGPSSDAGAGEVSAASSAMIGRPPKRETSSLCEDLRRRFA